MEKLPEQKTPEVLYPEITTEILAMCDADQDMREKSLKDDSWDESIDKKNTERMKEIVDEIGWPTVSKVGKEASNAAWLLVQHADHNVGFQSEVLSLIQNLSPEEVSPTNIAMLTDRVCVNEGRPQIYGTQFTQIDGKHVPRDIDDVEHVDERRRAMSLDTLDKNIQRMHEKYPIK